MTTDRGIEDVEELEEPSDGNVIAVTPRELLRHALVNDDDPRFPWWLPLPGLVLAALWAAYRAASSTVGADPSGASPLEVFVGAMLWPGAAIFVLGAVATWAGWQLEID